ncbi:MAG: dockerin type I domain-containing protein [Phycisphaerae bacterium]|jgi:hypothetical protein|nr:dockerin type I domain-containing protein [Phycisphaerae bacterium]
MRSVLLTTLAVFIAFGTTTSALGDVTPTGVSYMLHENWGGSWVDAEKSRSSSEDDNMCWAATAANVLEWTGWGRVEGMANSDDIFGYFQDHWTDQGGQMTYGWQWWMTGYNPSNGWSGWSQVDVPGGGFHPSQYYPSLYHRNSNPGSAMSALDTYLRSGYGTAIAIYGPGGHAITAWGFTHDAQNPSEYNGVYITDSDDYKNHPSAPDRLRYYEVELTAGKWHLQSYYGSNDWYIGGVYALEAAPRVHTPGDINGDSNVTADDIDLLAEVIASGVYNPDHDLNGDGRITTADRDTLIRDILNTEYGDFDLNGSVTAADYTIWANNYGESNVGWRNGDANGDDVVDAGDYTHWATGKRLFSASQNTATPEPGTLALLCMGGALAFSRRKSHERRQ